MKKQTLINAGKYGLGIVLLAYVVWRNWRPAPGSGGVGLADALQRPFQITPFVFANLIFTVSLFLTFVRWYVLVRAQDLPFTMFNATRLGLVGFFLSTFLPGSVGGDIIKAAAIAREQSRRTVAVATVLVDRAMGLWGLVWLVAILGTGFWVFGDPAIHDQRALQIIVLSAISIVAASLSVWFLLGVLPDWRAERFAGRLQRIPKLGHSIAELWRAIWMYRRRGGSMALALLLAVVGHVGFVLTFYFAARTFIEPSELSQIPSLTEHYLIVPIGMTVQAFAPTPGGAGLGELGFGGLYKMVGKPESDGVLASFVARVISLWLGMVGYLLYLWMKPALPISNGNHVPKDQEEIVAA